MPSYRFSGYQYETSPRKLEPEYEPQVNPYVKKKSSTLKKKSANNSQVQKRKLKSHIKTVMYIVIIFGVLFMISYRNSLINEKFSKNEKLKSTLAVTQKENEQLQVNIENSLNLNNIEKIAREKLGMQKLDSSQKVYVNLPKKDYVESAVEEIKINGEDEGWLQKILNYIINR